MSDKMLVNANKIAFIAHKYPEHKLNDIVNLLQMPAIDINAGLWRAQEEGFIGTPDMDTGEVERLQEPKVYSLGQEVEDLRDALEYCFNKLADRESDLEENYLSQWTNGYTGHDVLIAMRLLIDANILAEYTIDDPEKDENGNLMYEDDEVTPVLNKYTFYTLWQNREQMWGAKNFKVNPITGEKQDEDTDNG